MKDSEKGFTLLEVLFALFIISMIILAVNRVIYTVKKGNEIAEEVFEITNNTQNILEYLKKSEKYYTVGSYSLNEIINDNHFISSPIIKDIYKDLIIEFVEIPNSSLLGYKLVSINITAIWEGINGENIYKISTYSLQEK